ncbi:hypothetical protein HG1285_09586, partial [Hydrogenivirga sp. 128-5-R1-1]
MTEKEKFKFKLKEIFQFPYEDLDFGIYKVYKYKRHFVEDFIENKIDEIIEKQFKELSSINLKEIEEEFEEIKKEAEKNFGKDNLNNIELLKNFPLGRKYLELKEKYEKAKKESKLSQETINNIYSHL